MKEKENLGDLAVDGRQNASYESRVRGMNCIHQAGNRFQWLSLVNAPNHRVP
jgi:hypothetical protein